MNSKKATQLSGRMAARASAQPSGLMLILLLLVALGFAPRLSAQIAGEGAIQGRVSDPSGAVIQKAMITALQRATESRRSGLDLSRRVHHLTVAGGSLYRFCRRRRVPDLRPGKDPGMGVKP